MEKAARQNSVTSAVKDKSRIQAVNTEQLKEVSISPEQRKVELKRETNNFNLTLLNIALHLKAATF